MFVYMYTIVSLVRYTLIYNFSSIFRFILSLLSLIGIYNCSNIIILYFLYCIFHLSKYMTISPYCSVSLSFSTRSS